MTPKYPLTAVIVLLIIGSIGCCLKRRDACSVDKAISCCPVPATEQLEPTRAKLQDCCQDTYIPPLSPDSIGEGKQVTYWDLDLQEAIETGLRNSEVLRDLGGSVLRSPESSQTVHDPAAAFTDPRLGEEAALSAFDANFVARSMFDKNDRETNNRFVGDGEGYLKQDLGNYNFELNKLSATGTRLALRNTTDYDFSNSISRRIDFPASWSTWIDAEVRHPLLQGGGLLFNRIAGPSDQPGVLNGVLLARIRTDTSLTDFEVGVRNLVSNIENAYWDLFFAYRDFDVKKQARDYSARTLQQVTARVNESQQGAPDLGGVVGKSELYQAQEQYWRFEGELLDSLNGRLLDGTRTNNGSSGGTFRNLGGVRLAERRLRLLMGVAINDGRLIRPIAAPPTAPVLFDWEPIAQQALAHRPEVRKQEWKVKQRELELNANRNFLLPQLDAIARYRWRGFGQDLIKQGNEQFDSAWGNLVNGDYQEWQLGFELNVPIGYRRAHAAVRNSELQLARERAILNEQKRNVMLGLSNAVNETQRAYDVLKAQYSRRTAANEQVKAISLAYEYSRAPLDLLLEAQRRKIEADTRYFQSRVEYAISLKNVHFEKGTLLEYNQISLTEGPSRYAAYAQADARRQARRGVGRHTWHDAIISSGPAGVVADEGLVPAAANLDTTEHTIERLPTPMDGATKAQ